LENVYIAPQESYSVTFPVQPQQ